MNKITETEWSIFHSRSDDHICDERCVPGYFTNPVADQSTICECTHELMAHWKSKKCRAYGCSCQKFVADENI